MLRTTPESLESCGRYRWTCACWTTPLWQSGSSADIEVMLVHRQRVQRWLDTGTGAEPCRLGSSLNNSSAVQCSLHG
jgi:hypothetical protein